MVRPEFVLESWRQVRLYAVEAVQEWPAAEGAFRLASGAGQRGLAIFVHADPWERSENAIFAPFLREMAAGAKRLGKPVLFVHGDSHIYQTDQPFRDAEGHRVKNLTRLEVPGFPFVGWVKVTVDPNDPDLFRLERRN